LFDPNIDKGPLSLFAVTVSDHHVTTRNRGVSKDFDVMHADFVRSIGRLPLHPLNVFFARETLPTYEQHEILSFDAFEKGAVVPRLGCTVLAIDFGNLRAILVKIAKRRRINSDNVFHRYRTSSKEKSESTSEGNAQKESHQGDKQTKKPLFHVRTSLQLREHKARHLVQENIRK